MEPIPLVRRAALIPAISYLTAEGVPVRRYLRHAGLSNRGSENLESLIPLHQVCHFLSFVAHSEGFADLGFRIAGHRGMENLGTYGRFVAQSLTIHDAIQNSRKLIASYNSGLQIWLEHHGDQVRYCQKYTKALPQERITEIVQLGLMNAMSQAYDLVGADWQVKRIELASDPIDLTKYFPALANVPIAFRQPFTSVWVHQSVMSAPVRRLDVPAHKLQDGEDLESYVESGPSSDPIGQLKQAIESVLDHPTVGVRLTASIIGTSARTLQRRLTDQDTSFSRLLQAIRFRTAHQLLEDPKMPLKEIASRLGYTDVANFIRAFKRWTGVGPSQYRRLHHEPERE